MGSARRWILAVVAGAALCEASWAQEGVSAREGVKAEENRGGTELDRRLDEIDVRLESVKTLKARFEQRKFTPILKKPLVSSGKVAVLGERTLWETQRPNQSVMLTDSRQLRVYYPDQKVIEVYELGEDVRGFSGSPLPRIAPLRAMFEISEGRGDGKRPRDEDVLVLELLPKGETLKKHVERVRVEIDTRVPCARRIEITDIDGERTEIEFRDVTLNAKVDEDEVVLKAPAGTREVWPLGEGGAGGGGGGEGPAKGK